MAAIKAKTVETGTIFNREGMVDEEGAEDGKNKASILLLICSHWIKFSWRPLGSA